jgi:prophage regulatory protein
VNTPGDVLIDLGTALVAFGTALQLAGTRLQANQLQPAIFPQTAAPVPTAPVTSGLPADGYVRIWDIIGRRAAKGRPAITAMIPVSSATWYAGVKSGRFPKPIKHGGIAMWRVEDIRALVAQLGR